jgi:hypothetical protein
MIHIVRDEQTGRIKGTTKIRPVWATERILRRALLMPAIRQLGAVLRYYRDGRKAEEVMRETGYSRAALMELLVATRKGLGITRDAKGARSGRRNARQRISAKHDQFHDGFSVQASPWNSRGRRYHPTFDEAQLQDYFLGPAMQRYEIARAFWVEGLTSGEVAARFGIKKKAVEYQLARVRRVISNPLQPVHVMRRTTKGGLRRDGVTAPYTRRASVVQLLGSRDMVEV